MFGRWLEKPHIFSLRLKTLNLKEIKSRFFLKITIFLPNLKPGLRHVSKGILQEKTHDQFLVLQHITPLKAKSDKALEVCSV